MKLEFKPEDFHEEYNTGGLKDTFQLIRVAEIANARLQEMLKVCPVVYGCNYPSSKGWGFDQQGILKETTHKAILVNIEPIEKLKCEHEPIEYDFKQSLIYGLELGEKTYSENSFKVFAYECSKCGAKLEAKWEEVK